jgi:PAS domain S-box-containing protein
MSDSSTIIGNSEQQLGEMNNSQLDNLNGEHEWTEQMLRDGDRGYRAIIDALPTAIYITDAHGRITHFNPACIEFSGRTPQLGSDHWCVTWKLFHPDGRPMPHDECPMAITLKEGRAVRGMEAIAERPDGTRIWFEPYPTPLFDDAGNLVGGINMLVDITERKRAERDRAHLAAIVTSSEDAIVSKNLDGVITSWNRGAEHVFGYTAEEAIGKPVTILIPPDHLDEEPRILERIRRGESVEHYETVRRRKDGSLLDISLTVSPIRDASGAIIGASKVARDISQRKHAEHALRDSEERFRMLADNMAQLAWTCDQLGNVTWYNQRWLDYTGLSFDDMKDWGWTKCHHPDHVERVVASVTRSRESGEIWEDTFPLRGKDGQYRWFLSRAIPIRDSQGNILRWFGTNTDISEEREARQQAHEANLAKDMFLATLSHEMRTPLSAIVGWMHILRGGTESGCSPAELNEGLEVIDRNAQAMLQLLNDVLDVSRIVSGKLRLEVGPSELTQIIRDGIDVVRSATQAKEIELSADLDPSASATSCDAARMQQVVWNLLSNAIKFTPKGGKVHVTLQRAGSDLRIAVSDNGQGISPELLPFVFDRFRQADGSTRRQFGGLGLGLSIAKHLVEMHGGTIRAESAGEGQGATFTVLLPIRAVRVDECEDESPADDPARTGPPLARLNTVRVLVVDDEPDARRLLAKTLQQAGAIVTTAASAAEAIAALPDANPDVLVSDLAMPEQDGFDLIRRIRADGHHAKDLPAVALTAFVRPQDRRQALLAGYQMHLPKPVDPHDLTASIATLAGRGE